MEITIDYSSPAIFSSLVAVSLAFFIMFRNYRLHLNALFGALGVFSSIWFFLFYLLEVFASPLLLIYILVLSAFLFYFLFLLLNRLSTLKTDFEKIIPEDFLYFPQWVSILIGAEVFIVSLLFFVFVLASSSFFDISETTYAGFAEAVVFFTFIFILEIVAISLYSTFRLVRSVHVSGRKWLEKSLAISFGLFWILFSLGCLVLSSETFSFYRSGSVFSASLPDRNGDLAALLILSLLGIILVLAVLINRRYFCSYKVSITQLIATIIVMLNFLSILNAGGVEEIVLRAILIMALTFLSHLLVQSVVGEVQKKELIQETAQKIFAANKSLHKLDRAKSDFISAASHQLRGPLSVVKGIGSMLLDGSYGKMAGSVKDALEKVYISNERLIGLIEDLLDISHLEEGRVDFNFTRIDLNEIAQKATDGLILQAQNKKLYLKFSPWKKSKKLVWVDKQKVTEAISNLIDNAIKYTRKGGVKVEVKKSGSFVRVIVKDTGIGLRKDEIKNLFQKFVRAGRGNKMSTVGTGLGLYVVRKMIEAHKGKIWAESTGEGRGSSFIIQLPLNLDVPPNEKFIKRIVMEKASA